MQRIGDKDFDYAAITNKMAENARRTTTEEKGFYTFISTVSSKSLTSVMICLLRPFTFFPPSTPRLSPPTQVVFTL
jgi:hypothetical protein